MEKTKINQTMLKRARELLDLKVQKLMSAWEKKNGKRLPKRESVREILLLTSPAALKRMLVRECGDGTNRRGVRETLLKYDRRARRAESAFNKANDRYDRAAAAERLRLRAKASAVLDEALFRGSDLLEAVKKFGEGK